MDTDSMPMYNQNGHNTALKFVGLKCVSLVMFLDLCKLDKALANDEDVRRPAVLLF